MVKKTSMVRKTLYFRRDDADYLEKLGDATLSEHVRVAVDMYVNMIKGTASGSQSKGGDSHD